MENIRTSILFDWKLAKRLSEHKGYVSSIIQTKATGIHFNKPGHSVNNMKITVQEIMKSKDAAYRKERERSIINKFNTFHKGFNIVP